MLISLLFSFYLELTFSNLGNEDYRVRERASKTLDDLKFDAMPYIYRGLRSEDPEVRFRSDELYRKRHGELLTKRFKNPTWEAYAFLNDEYGYWVDPFMGGNWVSLCYAERLRKPENQIVMKEILKLAKMKGLVGDDYFEY